MIKASLCGKKRIIYMLFISIGIFLLLIIRIGFIQLVQGSELQSMAYKQQTLNRNINPKRGTIFDATGNVVLAMSATVQSITINPTNILKEQKEKVARALSDIFELDYEKTLKKVSKNSSIETIVKKVEKDKSDELRIWMNNNNITAGINIDEDTKRYYPYNNLASHVIGFCGSDNQGLDGIEAKYDEVLRGKIGRIQKQTDATGSAMKGAQESYTPATDGDDVVLSIDMAIQSIVEKYLKLACIDNVCTDGGNIIIINPKTGDVLAMATYPNYNLNSPYKIENLEISDMWNTLSQADKNKNLQQSWRNKAIADTYEPGSTFKLVTASAALEEGITATDNKGEFNCRGFIEVAGRRIKCWRYYRPHGSQSLREALMNSCNPIFIGLGQKLGVEKYYSYLEKFGLLNKTGIDLPGEAKGIFLAKNKMGPVELATVSFGQRFEITPIQMVRTVATIANGGELIQPRLVKQIINSKTGEVTNIEPKKSGRVISEETAKSVLSMMHSVVSEGTGKNAAVKGYSIGGKTGTSEDGVNTNKYVTSFVGVSPIEDPEIAMIITLYNPTGEGGHQGGGVAAPIASQVLSEVLPYLEVKKSEETEEDKKANIEVPNVRNKTIIEAKKELKNANLQVEINNVENIELTEDMIVNEQLPKPGIKILEGNKVVLYIKSNY